MLSPGRIRSVLLVLSLGSLSLLSSTRGILVTEIFFDGSDEWIELSNETDLSYSGTVYLSGLKPSPVPLAVVLDAGQSLVFADLDQQFTAGVSVQTGYGWSITDTAAMQWELLDMSGSIIDTISIATGTTLSANNQHASLSLSGGQREMTTATGSIGMIDGYNGSPTYRGDHLIYSLLGSGHEHDPDPDPVLSDCIAQPTWRISEVFLGSETMSPFVELQSLAMVANPVIAIDGEGLSGVDVSASGQRYTDDFLLVPRGDTGIINDDIDFLADDKSQLSGGTIAINGQSGQVLDRVSVSHVISGSQNFVGHQC